MDKIKLAIAGVLLSVVSFLVGSTSLSPKTGGGLDFPPFRKMAVSSSVLVGATDTLIQASTTRQYMVIVNDGTVPVYLALDGDAASEAYKGIRLNAAGGAYEICADCNNLYSGAIRAIAVGGTATVTVSQF